MTRHETIDPLTATAVLFPTKRNATYAEQVREYEELYAQGRRDLTSWTVSLPFFQTVNTLSAYSLAFAASTVVLTAIMVGLGA
ncbi:MAG: hypothetical protein AAF501_06010 [Pseudomonadota bacterium]